MSVISMNASTTARIIELEKIISEGQVQIQSWWNANRNCRGPRNSSAQISREGCS